MRPPGNEHSGSGRFTAAPTRSTGFYWVLQRGASAPEVARWEHECWWVTGEKRQLLDEDVRVLSARIVEVTT